MEQRVALVEKNLSDEVAALEKQLSDLQVVVAGLVAMNKRSADYIAYLREQTEQRLKRS